MSDHKPPATEPKHSRLDWVNAVMPFLTSNNFFLLSACLLSVIGGSFLDARSLICQMTQGQICPESSETAISIKSLLASDIQQDYGLYPIQKPTDSGLTEAELQQYQRNLAVAIAKLCTADELNDTTGAGLAQCTQREVLIQELRDMAGLAGKKVETSIFQTLPQEIYVSQYAVEINTNSSRNADYINRYVAHVCNERRQEGNGSGEFRYRLLEIYNEQAQRWEETQLRGIPTLPCGSKPEDISEFQSLPSGVSEIIRLHPDVYRELFGSRPAPLKAKVRIQIEPIDN
ncbi:MAG TPA: hypothetical protein V6D02_05475 [Candidatus Obscuribacterales bacterium]